MRHFVITALFMALWACTGPEKTPSEEEHDCVSQAYRDLAFYLERMAMYKEACGWYTSNRGELVACLSWPYPSIKAKGQEPTCEQVRADVQTVQEWVAAVRPEFNSACDADEMCAVEEQPHRTPPRHPSLVAALARHNVTPVRPSRTGVCCYLPKRR